MASEIRETIFETEDLGVDATSQVFDLISSEPVCSVQDFSWESDPKVPADLGEQLLEIHGVYSHYVTHGHIG